MAKIASKIARKIEKDFRLEDGELDGVTVSEAYEILHAEDGELDRYFFDEGE